MHFWVLCSVGYYNYVVSQSISGGKSFAEILFGETMEQPSASKDSLLRGCSLHKVCSLSITSFLHLKNQICSIFESSLQFAYSCNATH